MSKTFKSAKSTLELTVVRTNEDLVRIITQLPDETGRAIDLAPSDAPALALAILEAAGTPMNLDVSLGKALYHLDAHVTLQAKATAEAKEQAELEAEALDFLNAVRDATGAKALSGFPAYASGIKSHYLIIARKAREMAKEAPSA